MKKITILFAIPLLLFFLFSGCSKEPLSSNTNQSVSLAPLIIPSGATVVSATLHVYAVSFFPYVVDVHRVTTDWNEVTVTWNSFGAQYDPSVAGSFATANGWNSVDITDLVNSWISGTYMNFGLLLSQNVEQYPIIMYDARENTVNHPYLEICYDDGTGVACIQAEVVADTYIRELYPDDNYGISPVFYTGWTSSTDLEKQSLLRFELQLQTQQNDTTTTGGDTTNTGNDTTNTGSDTGDSTVIVTGDGCTHTIGYWKNHSGFGPQPNEISQHLPIWLGDEGGPLSLLVDDSTTAVNVLKMKTYGSPKNGITKLYAQLLGAKLSIASGASGFDIQSEISEADAFLATHDWNAWNSMTRPDKHDIIELMSTFDDYNNGYIGPGHCDEFDPDGDYTN